MTIVDANLRRIPAVSVVIPTWNRAELVCKAVDSVLSQSFSDFELLVIDDGSTDDTGSRLARYGARLRYLPQANAGVSSARNLGIANSRGKWIAFLDSDDTWDPRKLQMQMDAVDGQGRRFRLCFTDCRVSRGAGVSDTLFVRAGFGSGTGEMVRIGDPVAQVTSRDLTVHTSSMLADGEWLRTHEAFDPRLEICEDTDLLLRMALDGEFCAIDLPLVNIGTDDGATSSRLSHKFDTRHDEGFASRARLHLKWRDELNLPGHWAKWNIEQMRHIHADWVVARMRHGEFARASRAFNALAHAEGSRYLALRVVAQRSRMSLLRRWRPAPEKSSSPWRP